MAIQKKAPSNNATRYVLISVLIVAAFFGAYKFAAASSARTQSPDAQATPTLSTTAAAATGVTAATGAAASGGAATGGAAAGSSAGGVAAGGCCGGGVSGSSAAGGGTAGGCCGGSAGSQAAIPGTAKLSGGVQKISVDVTTVYKPNVLKLKAGVPAEISFSAAQGCTGLVQSRALGFAEDLTTGPKTVQVNALQPGTYDFECGMNMVQGQIVVE